jgi:hypothetical protein
MGAGAGWWRTPPPPSGLSGEAFVNFIVVALANEPYLQLRADHSVNNTIFPRFQSEKSFLSSKLLPGKRFWVDSQLFDLASDLPGMFRWKGLERTQRIAYEINSKHRG